MESTSLKNSSASEKKILAKIFRFDPSTDEAPYYATYDVPWRENMTVLEVLRYVYENYDPVAFRYNCRSGTCGLCGVILNGKPVLACEAFVERGESTIEPLRRFPVIRDLVVDREKIDTRALETRPWLHRAKPPEKLERIPWDRLADFFEVTRCKACYLCYAACPIFEFAEERFAGPKVFTRDIALRAFDPRDEGNRLENALRQGVYYCTTCRACYEVCPREIKIPEEVIEKVRAYVTRIGLGPLEGHIPFINSIRETGRSVTRKTPSLLERVPDVVETLNSVDEVVFFTGCLMDYRLQKVGLALIEVLKRNRIKVYIPKNQSCCASPALRTGVLDVAEEQVRKNVEVLENLRVEKVIAGCAGCSQTLKNDFPKVMMRLRGEKPRFKVLDFTEYLVNDLGIENVNTKELGKIDMKVTYHDPCHLNRGQGIRDEPREVINLIPGLKLVEMEEAGKCCGAGGGVRSGARDVSMMLGKRKAELIAEAGVDACVNECPFCYIQIGDSLQQLGLDIRTRYIPELLAESYHKR